MSDNVAGKVVVITRGDSCHSGVLPRLHAKAKEEKSSS
jgi:precorrin-6B methylase 1